MIAFALSLFLAMAAAILWLQSRSWLGTGSMWVSYTYMEPAAPVVRHVTLMSEDGVVFLDRDHIEVVTHRTSFDPQTMILEVEEPSDDLLRENTRACLEEFGRYLGLRTSWSSDERPLGSRMTSPTFSGRLGFVRAQMGWIEGNFRASYQKGCNFVSLPHWALLAPAVLMGAWTLAARWLRSRRSQPGCCANCGYDLRMTPDRCPECGVAPAGAR
jgi:hypothetical protein